MRQSNFKFSAIAVLTFAILSLTGCPNSAPTTGGNTDPNGSAASVNGKAIKMEEVERAVKQQGQGQEAKLSPLELAQARLQILDGLIQQEVMYQKAEKEKTVPSDEDVNQEFNKQKTASGLSADEFDKKMQEAGETDASLREKLKKTLAIQKLVGNITGKVEPPKDSEIDAFYNGNKNAFINKRGVKLAAIVIDPADSGEGDDTKNEQEAVLKGNEIIKQLKAGGDFAAIAREKSEDQSRLQGGDLGNISEDELKQGFPPQIAANLMNPQFPVGQIMATPMQGKFYILKLQERNDKDEPLTLESPGVRQKIIDQLISARKQILAASYQSIAMDEAKIENFLAKQILDNPNGLSGARPADASANSNTNAPANTNAAANTNATAANTNVRANTVGKVNTAAPATKPPAAPGKTANVKK